MAREHQGHNLVIEQLKRHMLRGLRNNKSKSISSISNSGWSESQELHL